MAKKGHLVGGVEEGEHVLLLDCLQDATPLLGRGVHTGGVVRACVQQHYGALWRPPQILQHALLHTNPFELAHEELHQCWLAWGSS